MIVALSSEVRDSERTWRGELAQPLRKTIAINGSMSRLILASGVLNAMFGALPFEILIGNAVSHDCAVREIPPLETQLRKVSVDVDIVGFDAGFGATMFGLAFNCKNHTLSVAVR